MTLPNYHAQEFDLSNVTLKELKNVLKLCWKNPPAGKGNGGYDDLDLYEGFLQKSIQIKTIDEMNKHYFGGKISLKTKRLEDDGWVEYEPLFPK